MSSSLLTPDSDPNFLYCTSPCSKSLPPGFCFPVCFIYLFLLLFLSSVFLFLYSILTHGSTQPLIPSYQNLSMASLRASLPAEQSHCSPVSLGCSRLVEFGRSLDQDPFFLGSAWQEIKGASPPFHGNLMSHSGS